MVEYLEIFGKEYPVRIGYYVMKKVKEKTGEDFQKAIRNIDDDGNIELHEVILYHALEMGQYAEEKNMDIDFDKDDMPMVLDVCFSDYIQLFSSDTFFPEELREQAKQGTLPEAKNQGNGQKDKDEKSQAKRTT